VKGKGVELSALKRTLAKKHASSLAVISDAFDRQEIKWDILFGLLRD